MIDSKTYCYGKNHKSRLNYPVGFCGKRKECDEKECKDCIRVNGKYTGFVKK